MLWSVNFIGANTDEIRLLLKEKYFQPIYLIDIILNPENIFKIIKNTVEKRNQRINIKFLVTIYH